MLMILSLEQLIRTIMKLERDYKEWALVLNYLNIKIIADKEVEPITIVYLEQIIFFYKLSKKIERSAALSWKRL